MGSVLLIIFLFLNQLIYSQEKATNQKIGNIQEINKIDFGLFTMKLYEQVLLDDGTLLYWDDIGFLTLSNCNNENEGDIALLFDKQNPSLFWEEYEIQLQRLPTEDSLNIKVSKKMKNGKIISINKGEELKINDSLSIRLNRFTHRRPMPWVGSGTELMVDLTFTEHDESKEIFLSEQGKNRIPNSEHFERLCLDKYNLQLKSYVYDKSAKIFIAERENRITILLNEEEGFGDLAIRLTGFSSKNGIIGNDNYKSTVRLTVTEGPVSESISLSMYGNYTTTTKTFDAPIYWNDYKIQLDKFSFGESIEVIISKIK